MNKNTEAQKILSVQQKSGLSKKDFAASLGLSDVQFSHILAGDRSLSREVLDNLQTMYNVDLNWFLSGSGSSTGTTETAYIELVNQEAAAGTGSEIEEYADKITMACPLSVIKPYPPSTVKGLFVRGDSMIGENIFDGNIVIYTNQVTTGDYIFVVSIGTTLVVKRVEFDELHQSITLISANPAYSPRVLTGADREAVKIEGKVIAIIQKL